MYQRWALSQADKEVVRQQMLELVKSGKNRERIMAAKVLLDMEAQNLAAETKPQALPNLQAIIINIAQACGLDEGAVQRLIDDST